MNEDIKEPITIAIGDQVFRVRVAPGERERYARIAQGANDALQDVLESGVVGGPRALAMTIFQLAAELEDARESLRAARAARDERLRQIINRIDEALDTHVASSE